MEKAKAGGWEHLKQVTFKAFNANFRSFSEHWKCAYLETKPAGVTCTPHVTQEADEQQSSLSGNEVTDEQWKSKPFHGCLKVPTHAFWLERAVHVDDRAFCTALPTCREGTQKISVESLVREDEWENLKEMHIGWALYQMHESLFLSLFPYL